MRDNKTRNLVLAALCVVMNVVLGVFVSWLSIPLLFLDTLGTILISVLLGSKYGILVGVSTNLLMGITNGATAIPFALVNVAVALVVGFMARKEYTLKNAIITGLILAVVAPLIGTPIRLALFGGFTGSGTDMLIFVLMSTGRDLFSSTFISAITGNLVDKIVSCIVVHYLAKHRGVAKSLGLKKIA